MAHVTRASRAILRGKTHVFDFLQQPPGLVQREAPAVAGVEHFTRDAVRFGSLQKKSYNIVDVSEIARLFSVAENSGLRRSRRHAMKIERTPE
jgi:hypothetical protein